PYLRRARRRERDAVERRVRALVVEDAFHVVARLLHRHRLEELVGRELLAFALPPHHASGPRVVRGERGHLVAAEETEELRRIADLQEVRRAAVVVALGRERRAEERVERALDLRLILREIGEAAREELAGRRGGRLGGERRLLAVGRRRGGAGGERDAELGR